MDRKLQKGIAIVFATNIINLFFSLATNFLLPKFLSIECYAGIKTFQLYISYIGLLHFGYVDSVYLSNGGKELDGTLGKEYSLNMSTMRIMQIVVSICTIFISLLIKDNLLLFFALSILPINMNSYFKYLYQATGNFSRYGRIMNFSAIVTFAVNMLIIFVFRLDNYYHVVMIYVCTYYAIWITLEYRFKQTYTLEKSENIFSFHELSKNIRNGIFLTVGNLASLFLTSMDRWFVKFLLDTTAFAQYSFAVSVEGFLNVAITPITTTLYNFFCRETDERKHQQIFNYIVIFASVLPCAAFPVKFVLERFLPAYMGSSKVIFFLFGAQMFFVVINAIFVNLYKAQKKQQLYFMKLMIVLLVGFVLNIFFYQILKCKEAFAIGTLLSACTWFFISLIDFKYLKVKPQVVFYIGLEIFALLFLGMNFTAIKGFILYIIFTTICGLAFMRSVYTEIIRTIKTRIRR